MTPIQIRFLQVQAKRAARKANEAMRDGIYIRKQIVIV
jgi:hypothetical protein